MKFEGKGLGKTQRRIGRPKGGRYKGNGKSRSTSESNGKTLCQRWTQIYKDER